MTTNHTAESFQSGKAKHNAEVAIALWHRESIWVDEAAGCLLVYSSSGDSAGDTSFDELVDQIAQLDSERRLTAADRRAAAAMIFHLAPTMVYGDESSIAG